MRSVTQSYKKARITDLTPHPANPRHGDIGAIHTSIERNGFYGAVIVQKATGYILAGNHRVQAATHAGATTIPIIEIDVDDQTATRILLADNRTSDLATNDSDTLASLLRDLLAHDGIEGTGYDHDDLDALLADFDTPDLNTPDPNGAGAHSVECPNCGHTFTLVGGK